MARTDSKEKRAAQEEAQLSRVILSIPGVVGEPIWRELAEEAEAYLDFYKRLSNELADSPEREALEDKMILSLAHLTVHSQVLYSSIDEAIEADLVEKSGYEDVFQTTFEENSKVEMHNSLEVGVSAQKAIIAFWSYLNKATESPGEAIRRKRAQLERVVNSNKKQAKRTREITQVLDSIAVLIEQYTDDISARLPEYRYNIGKYVEAYSKFVFWLASTEYTEAVHKQELYEALKSFKETLKELAGVFSEFIDNVQSTARTALEELNHVKLSDACKKLVNKLVGTLDTVRELDAFTENILAKLDPGDWQDTSLRR